ncbi:Sec-independent protein translocase protein TatB [Glacieibacterium sp.]|uniref:Sec-independent protein translocase protein TatB n=1 Tax=Glacieibacterium sp. TaxID=2860237 RepID=UPI003B00F017
MFGIDGSELAVIAIVALVVIGPKDLPRVMRIVGQWVGKGRAMSRHVRAGFDTMMREAELDEMQKQWDAQNAAIIASTQVTTLDYSGPVEEALTVTPAEIAHDAQAGSVEHGGAVMMPLADTPPAIEIDVHAATPAPMPVPSPAAAPLPTTH